jgi:hypothetical protein
MTEERTAGSPRTATDIEFPLATRYDAKVQREDGTGWDDLDVEVRELSVKRFVQIAQVLGKALRESDFDVFRLIVEHDAEAMQALALALAQPLSVIERLPSAQFAELAFIVFEKNRDSFVRRLSSRNLAGIATLLAGTQEATPTNGAGTTSSSTSASTASPSLAS